MFEPIDSFGVPSKDSRLKAALVKSPVVAVFQAKTYGKKERRPEELDQAIMEDAVHKVDAMYAGGVRSFEFLARGYIDGPVDTDSPKGVEYGDKNIRFDQTYVGRLLKAIDVLAVKYPDAIFGVGSISNPHMMEKVTENPNIAFVMTANWPKTEEIGIAQQHGVPIFATTCYADDVHYNDQNGGEVVEPPSVADGNDRINPEHLAELQELGVEDMFKVFHLLQTGANRASLQTKTKPTKPQSDLADTWAGLVKKNALTPEQKVAFALIAMAEAIKASFGGSVPSGQKFYVATTGGVDENTLPSLADHKSPAFQKLIEEILGAQEAAVVNGILKHVVLGAGGTLLVKRYEAAISEGKPAEEAKLLLKEDAAAAVAQATKAAAQSISR